MQERFPHSPSEPFIGLLQVVLNGVINHPEEQVSQEIGRRVSELPLPIEDPQDPGALVCMGAEDEGGKSFTITTRDGSTLDLNRIGYVNILGSTQPYYFVLTFEGLVIRQASHESGGSYILEDDEVLQLKTRVAQSLPEAS